MTISMTLQNIGQIKEANLEFGDVTVFVGPQATGKSIALQFLKLMIDAGQVQEELGRYGLDWAGKLPDFLDVYFGEGMKGLWSRDSGIYWCGKSVDMQKMVRRKRPNKQESLFFIPAQRVLALRDGWPRPFTDYTPGDPFIVREFSEQLRNLIEQDFASTDRLFPQDRRLKKELRELLERHVFSHSRLKVDKFRSQKRLVLGNQEGGEPLPYMVWSAGQREFVPLLLGFYWLLPPGKTSKREQIDWVVLEELEMGLHPRAISVVLLFVFELISRGYRVCLSTHSPQILDALWALKNLRENKAPPEDFLEIFGSPNTQAMRDMMRDAMSKCVKVFFFDRDTGKARDISDLDPMTEGSGDAGLGGLSEFSGRASEVVARSVANKS